MLSKLLVFLGCGGAAAAELRLTGRGSMISFADPTGEATLTSTCNYEKASVSWMSPLAFTSFPTSPTNVTVELMHVPRTCVDVPANTPCAPHHPAMPSLFFCNFFGEGGNVTTMGKPTLVPLTVPGSAELLSVAVHLQCPLLTWDELVAASAYRGMGNADVNLEVTYVAVRGSPNAVELPFAGNGLASALTFVGLPMPPAAPPSLPPAPPPSPPPPPANPPVDIPVITNGDLEDQPSSGCANFEDGYGWSRTAASGSYYPCVMVNSQYGSSTGPPQGGTKSLHFTNGCTTAGRNSGIEQVVDGFEPGKNYMLTFDIAGGTWHANNIDTGTISARSADGGTAWASRTINPKTEVQNDLWTQGLLQFTAAATSGMIRVDVAQLNCIQMDNMKLWRIADD